MRAADSQTGTVYAEFLVAFMPFFLLFLGGVQLALIAQARIVVQHAASQAVRAAVTSIDDDPVFYDDGARKALVTVGKGTQRQSSQQLVGRVSNQKTQQPPPQDDADKPGSGRLDRVRNAAYLPLSVISPSPWQVYAWVGNSFGTSDNSSVEDAVGDSPLARVMTGLAMWGRMASAVTFPKVRGKGELRDPNAPWEDQAPVHARVTFLFPCNVPLVRGLICRSMFGMQVDSLVTRLKNMFRKKPAADPAKQALKELGQAELPTLQKVLYLFHNERFIALRGEASLLNQGAAYKYPSELCKTKIKAPGVACPAKP